MENPSAFPHKTELCEPQCGMTLRDYFAGIALGTMYAPANVAEMSARKAYEMADAMLKARAALGEKE